METIRLDELAMRQLGVSRQEADGLIMAGRIFIGEIPADKAGTPVPADTVLTLREKAKKYASRSGYKLERALADFKLDVTGLQVCDIGASNGGFTDCLLQHGAAKVCAVDVAYGILAWELRSDERVKVLERTNARHLTPEDIGGMVDMVTADVSFISLTKIFPAVDRILRPDGRFVCLIKPQFEAPPRALGKNGIIRDPAVLPPLLCGLADAAAENHLYLRGMIVSPIHGTNGNVEYLMYCERTPLLTAEERAAGVENVLRQQPDL